VARVLLRLALGCLILAHACDLLFFSYYGYRMNYLVLEYAGNTEVWHALLRRPAVCMALLGVSAVTLLAVRALGRSVRGARATRAHAAVRLAVFAAALLAARGTLDHRPLNPSAAAITSNRVLNEVAGSGLFTLAYELGRRLSGEAVELSDLYARLPDAEAARRVKRIRSGLGVRSVAASSASGKRPRNVVLVVMESFTGRLVGALGGRPGLSPEFDALAREGQLWTYCYATGERTVQGLEAVVASFPPLPGVSVIRRPQAAGRIPTLGSALGGWGYDTLVAYGGQGSFDHMRAFFLSNGFERFIG